MIKNKPMLAIRQSIAQDSKERGADPSKTIHSSSSGKKSESRPVAKSKNFSNLGKLIENFGGIEGIASQIERIQPLITAISPILPLLGGLFDDNSKSKRKTRTITKVIYVYPRPSKRSKRK